MLASCRLPHRALLSCMLMLFCAAAPVASAQTTDDTAGGPLAAGPLQRNSDVATQHAFDNDGIVRMVKAGVPESIILQTIETQPAHYDVSADGLIALQQAGVTPAIMSAMQAKSSGFTLRSADGPRRSLPGKLLPGTAPNGQALEEVGVYYKDKSGDWVPLKTEKATEESGGFLKSTLTHGIISKDMNGRVYRPHSTLILPKGVQILIYTPSGVDATEYDFIRFREKSDHREFRALTGGVIHSKTGAERDEVDFNPERVAPRMYVFTVPADIVNGDYGVLPPGLTVNKVYTFRLPE